jgi:hypothetical protein
MRGCYTAFNPMKARHLSGKEDPAPRRARKLWIGASIAVLVLIGCLWWNARWPSYDEANVHPQLRGLTHPFQSFRLSYLTDGGTITMSGKDRTGRQFKVILPNRMGGIQGYQLIVVGGTYAEMESGAVTQEPLNPDTRYMLARFIRDYEDMDPDYAEAEAQGIVTWKYRMDCWLGQSLLRNKFPLCLDFDW